MQTRDDIDLLREYSERGSEEAFATLVQRYVNQVYSVALRHCNQPLQAEEITHVVFIILARKAPCLRRGTVLSGWLYQTARLTALTAVRSEIRRAHREQEAHMQSLAEQNEPDAWTQLAPLLDAAIAALDAKERDAIVLRFFDGKSMREVGEALATSEDAAKKRVARAVEKLRHTFAQRGVVFPAAVVTSVMAAHSVQAAPAHLTASVVTMATAKGAAGGSTSLTLLKVLKIMAWTKAKTAAVAVAAGVLAVGTVTVGIETGGFGIGRLLRDWLLPPRAGFPAAIMTQALNQAHRIPGALYTYPQGDEKTRVYLEALLEQFRNTMGPGRTVRSDAELTDADVQSHTIYIYGTPGNHTLFRRLRQQLPIVFEDDGVVVGDKKCRGRDVGAIFVCPNPLNPQHRLVVYGTVSPEALNNLNGVFHGPTDYVVFNDATRHSSWPERADKFLLVGAFNTSDPAHWRADGALQLQPSGALRKATAGVIVPHRSR